MTVSRVRGTGVNLWYVLIGDEVQGPFAAKLITRYLILGRIELSTEISQDRHAWKPISNYPELIPNALMPNDDGVIDQDRLAAARRWENERIKDDRRDIDQPLDQALGCVERRELGEDRRQAKKSGIFRRQSDAGDRAATQRGEHRLVLISMLIVVVLIGGIVGVAVNESWILDSEFRDCNVAPGPGVNWNHCSRKGADLAEANLSDATMISMDLISADLRAAILVRADMSYANLTGASLSAANMGYANLVGADLRDADLTAASLLGANLAYADLRGARITDAEIAGAVFDRAIWLDGRICEDLSRGECRQADAPPEIP